MRRQEFPFAKYRDWGKAPEKAPAIDFWLAIELNNWQSKIFRRPILDDITGYYQFFPSANGAASYVTRAAKRNTPVRQAGEDFHAHQDKIKRQINHIAESAELATSLFWSAAIMRQNALELTAQNDLDSGSLDRDTVRHYTADAIADYGYCLVYPVDISVEGNKSAGLRDQIERVAPGLGQTLLDFGNFAVDNPSILDTPSGELAMQITADEQTRRINHWAPRHMAVLSAFPEIKPDSAIMNFNMDFPELFKQHHELR